MREEPPTPGTLFVDHSFVQDERFRAELFRVSGNSGLTDALMAAGEPVRRVRMYGFLTQDRVEATVNGHIEITELVRTGRLDAAQRAMTQMALHAGLLLKPGNRTRSPSTPRLSTPPAGGAPPLTAPAHT
ncbi:FCD domain-containing protein [Streptomyces sp. NBC_00280]|uniref:FCD domain-containing protein n=1 Tax=Streptomyces sp. NBC_00280 TaxID=2975699 RepID=UPI0032491EAA